MRPAPMFRWPTSELPCWPSGSPTGSPAAASVVCGHRVQSASQLGFFAAAIAFPNGLVRYPQPSMMTSTSGRRGALDLGAVERGVQLTRDDLPGPPELVLLERLAHGQDDLQRVAKAGLQFSVELLVGFIEQLAPLGVPDQEVVAPPREHLRRNLTRKGSLVLPRCVLCADLERATTQQVRDL